MLPAIKANLRYLEEDSEVEWENESDQDEWDSEEMEYYEKFKNAERKALEALAQMKDSDATKGEWAFKEWDKKKWMERMLAKDGSHIHIQDVCGLCYQNIIKRWTMDYQPIRGDEIMALLNHHKDPYGTHPEYCSKMFFNPCEPKTIRGTDRYPLCNRLGCNACAASPESVTVHLDCYRVFMQAYPERPALEHVWLATAWKTPWTHTPGETKVHLDLADASLASVTASTAKSIGLPELESIPPEVLQSIRSYSSDHLFWRYLSIKAKAEAMLRFDESTLDYDNTSCKLDAITSWHRGEKLETNENGPQSGVFRITVDRYGVLDIERLAEQPEYRNCEPSSTHAYSFINFDEAEHTNVHFKSGHARIEPSNLVRQDYPFWDTPYPPTKDLDVLLRAQTVGAHLHTIDLRGMTGITFFYHGDEGTLLAIHTHTTKEPTAVSTVQRLSRVDPNKFIWFYLPISAGDRIMQLGLRAGTIKPKMPTYQVLPLLITTKLCRGLWIGPGSYGKKHLSQKVPSMMIHDIPREGGIGNLAVVGEEPRETLPKHRFHWHPALFQQSTIMRKPCVNSMTLRNAKRITVFEDASTGYFRGILLEYEDGTQRACGQCKIGVDPIKEYARPAFICKHEIPKGRNPFDVKNYELKFDTGEHKHGHGGASKRWQCSNARTMSITVKFDDRVSIPWIDFSEPGEEASEEYDSDDDEFDLRPL